jgi:hypothetical protein
MTDVRFGEGCLDWFSFPLGLETMWIRINCIVLEKMKNFRSRQSTFRHSRLKHIMDFLKDMEISILRLRVRVALLVLVSVFRIIACNKHNVMLRTWIGGSTATFRVPSRDGWWCLNGDGPSFWDLHFANSRDMSP